MAYQYETIKLDKSMYRCAGATFSQILEQQDPGHLYKGTELEGMDAFQRQLKRFDIKVKGPDSDCVEKFFRTADSAVLFPEYISRCVRQGMEEVNI
ncbi:MAG: phage major capsid protein, partial [Kiritimatiellae bacterium]|nr:phage major capsid protein [Kiritimatiellia bacterium]